MGWNKKTLTGPSQQKQDFLAEIAAMPKKEREGTLASARGAQRAAEALHHTDVERIVAEEAAASHEHPVRMVTGIMSRLEELPEDAPQHAPETLPGKVMEEHTEDTMSPSDEAAYWQQWAAHGPQGPITDDNADALQEFRAQWETTLHQFAALFADLAKPTLDGPASTLRGLAWCHEFLGNRGKAIEVLEVLVQRYTSDPSPPTWLAEEQQRLLALKVGPQRLGATARRI